MKVLLPLHNPKCPRLSRLNVQNIVEQLMAIFERNFIVVEDEQSSEWVDLDEFLLTLNANLCTLHFIIFYDKEKNYSFFTKKNIHFVFGKDCITTDNKVKYLKKKDRPYFKLCSSLSVKEKIYADFFIINMTLT